MLLIGLSFTICPQIMEDGASEPPTTKQQEGGGQLSTARSIFSSSASCVYVWVSGTIFDVVDSM